MCNGLPSVQSFLFIVGMDASSTSLPVHPVQPNDAANAEASASGVEADHQSARNVTSFCIERHLLDPYFGSHDSLPGILREISSATKLLNTLRQLLKWTSMPGAPASPVSLEVDGGGQLPDISEVVECMLFGIRVRVKSEYHRDASSFRDVLDSIPDSPGECLSFLSLSISASDAQDNIGNRSFVGASFQAFRFINFARGVISSNRKHGFVILDAEFHEESYVWRMFYENGTLMINIFNSARELRMDAFWTAEATLAGRKLEIDVFSSAHRIDRWMATTTDHRCGAFDLSGVSTILETFELPPVCGRMRIPLVLLFLEGSFPLKRNYSMVKMLSDDDLRIILKFVFEGTCMESKVQGFVRS